MSATAELIISQVDRREYAEFLLDQGASLCHWTEEVVVYFEDGIEDATHDGVTDLEDVIDQLEGTIICRRSVYPASILSILSV